VELESYMSKRWDDEYISQAIDEEIELAVLDKNLRGKKPSTVWFDAPVHQAKPRGALAGMYGGLHSVDLPRYRRNPRDAGELAIRRGVSVKHDQDDHSVSAYGSSSRRAVTEFYGAHPDPAAATMAAITRAAIQLLTEQRDERAALNPTRSKTSRRPSAKPTRKQEGA